MKGRALSLWVSLTVRSCLGNVVYSMVGGAFGDIADVLLAAPEGVSSELLESYRVVVGVGMAATLNAPLAAALAAAVNAGGLAILEADDIEAAGAWNWFPAGFFGASLTGGPPTQGECCWVPQDQLNCLVWC
jgi:hypothetical protein